MESLTQRLTTNAIIGLDTSIFIYHFENHPRYQPLTGYILDHVEKGNWNAVTSTITLMELTVRAWQLDREDIARKYETLLVHFPNLKVVDIDRSVARMAAQLRGWFNIRPPDAMQIAACLTYGGKSWITNDRKLCSLQPIVDVIVLDDYS